MGAKRGLDRLRMRISAARPSLFMNRTGQPKGFSSTGAVCPWRPCPKASTGSGVDIGELARHGAFDAGVRIGYTGLQTDLVSTLRAPP